MFNTLIASRHTEAGSQGGQIASFLVHSGVIITMILATTAAEPLSDAPRSTRIVPLVSPRSPAPQPAAPTRAAAAPARAPEVPALPIEAPAAPIDVPLDVPVGIPADVPSSPVTGSGSADPNTLPSTNPGTDVGTPVGSGAFDADGVDVAVRMRANSPLPRYPDVLRQSGVSGYVRVRFVVGTDGRAELATVEILEQSHAAFAEAVRNVLPRLRFTPARVGTRAVRQVVELPFGFELR